MSVPHPVVNDSITWGRTWWPVFLIISSAWILAGFGIAETIALLARRTYDNTLSNYARVQLHVPLNASLSHTVAWWLSLLTWMMFVVVMTVHIWWNQPI